MKVGDKVRFMPTAFKGAVAGHGIKLCKLITGKVVYIHPRRRWCRVEWEAPSGDKNHECFTMEEVKQYVKS